MRPLTITDSDIILGLQDEIRRSEKSRYDHRLHGALLVAGMRCPDVAKLLGDAPPTVLYWIKRFEQDGLAGFKKRIEPSWESDSASDCSGSWDFGFASPAQPVGGHFPAIWILLPHVDCFGSRRPRRLASSDAQICRLLRSCPAARWQASYRRQPEKQKFNGETYFDFLKHLKRCAGRSGRRVVMIVDSATCHHARLHKPWRNPQSTQFQLYFLPPYSPELNPIEHVWKLTREFNSNATKRNYLRRYV